MEESQTQGTTEGITRADVDQALAYLGIANPKPEIPLEVTVSGHEIVAVARHLKSVRHELARIRAAFVSAGLANHLR